MNIMEKTFIYEVQMMLLDKYLNEIFKQRALFSQVIDVKEFDKHLKEKSVELMSKYDSMTYTELSKLLDDEIKKLEELEEGSVKTDDFRAENGDR